MGRDAQQQIAAHFVARKSAEDICGFAKVGGTNRLANERGLIVLFLTLLLHCGTKTHADELSENRHHRRIL